jgi:SAM-dependent methyltransferase
LNPNHLAHLLCPSCQGGLELSASETSGDGRVRTGQLACRPCAAAYPIAGGIPRFVPRDNYASGFGLEWTRHARTQYDSHSGIKASEERFFGQTHWPRQMPGERILEVGSGSGRFTEQAASTGAFVVSFDYSHAVEANYASNGGRENVLIVQADVFAMPFARGSFDRLFCFGMLQHTPNPHGAFAALPAMLAPGGRLVADIYKATLFRAFLHTKYYVRPLTRRIPPERLYGLVQRYVDAMWPLCGVIRRVPRIGYAINWRLLVADYSFLGLRGDVLKEWAYLDTFDMLAPRYDRPQTLDGFRRWFDEAGLTGVQVEYTAHGIVGRAHRAENTDAK